MTYRKFTGIGEEPRLVVLEDDTLRKRLEKAPDFIKEKFDSEFRCYHDTDVSMLRWWADEQVWCPHCGAFYEVMPGETITDEELLAPYGTENGAVEVECNECYQAFWVTAHVSRTFECFKTAEEDD